MPVCKKCNNSFPNRLKIQGKIRVLSNRKYCLDCSPFGWHNTKSLSKCIDPNNMDLCRCKYCGKEYIYNRKKGHGREICNSCIVNNRRFKLKNKIIEYKGNKCQSCGYDRCKSALELHHLDASNKEFSMSGNHCRSWKIIKAEIDKCTMLCANCHREEHEKQHLKKLQGLSHRGKA